MKTVFLDTVGLIAIWDSADQWHEEAVAAYSRLESEVYQPAVTPGVLLECGNAAARRPYRDRVTETREVLTKLNAIFAPTVEELEIAWRQYDLGQPGSAGIVDCISFEVMRRLGIRQAFTNDQHFEAAGFETLF